MFRSSELPRLLTMVVMLGVLWLLIDRARDENTWRWITGDTSGAAALAQRDSVESDASSAPATEAPTTGPTDLDADERDAAAEEFQAITDKAPLAREEMPAYWRLLAWQQHQSTAELRRRAANKVSFAQLWQQPEKWRGKLVEIPVHLGQTARVDDLEDNGLGLKSLDEVWGWNSDSQPYWFWFVCPQLPPGMPTGRSLSEEATFVGYFLKLLPYEDHQGVTRTTPLLIGRLVWHPSPDARGRASSDGWSTWLILAGLASLMAVRWGWVWFGRRQGDRHQPRLSTADAAQVDDWLDRAEDPERDVDPPTSPYRGSGEFPPPPMPN